MDKDFNMASELVIELYEHLEYCNWGDSWERECSGKLRNKAREFIASKASQQPVATEAKPICDHEWEPCPAVKCEHCDLIIED